MQIGRCPAKRGRRECACRVCVDCTALGTIPGETSRNLVLLKPLCSSWFLSHPNTSTLRPLPHFPNVRTCRRSRWVQERFSAALDFFRQEQHGKTRHPVSFDALKTLKPRATQTFFCTLWMHHVRGLTANANSTYVKRDNVHGFNFSSIVGSRHS